MDSPVFSALRRSGLGRPGALLRFEHCCLGRSRARFRDGEYCGVCVRSRYVSLEFHRIAPVFLEDAVTMFQQLGGESFKDERVARDEAFAPLVRDGAL